MSGACGAHGPSLPSGAGGGEEGPTREARQGISADVCLTIARSGASGGVFDTQVADKLPLTKNYGASGTMNAGMVDGGERTALLRFDLSAIPPGPGTNIVTASIALSLGITGATGPGVVQVHRVTAPWDEATVSYESFAGALDPTIEASMSNGAPTLGTNLHNLVVGWVHGTLPNYGIALTQLGPYGTNFWTSEYTNYFQRPSLYVCYNVTCPPGFADCNGDGADGCETDLGSSPQHCGACGRACSVPNAADACVAGACAVGACDLGFGDCDGLAQNGCETLLSTGADCGACGVACALPHGTASCATGTCALTACDPGAYDCDGDPSNGCEVTPCQNGSRCATGAGCTSGVCLGGFCASPACNDGIQNGAESAVDCGGGSCPPCADGQACGAASDCASGVCVGGECQSPTCADGVKNGNESAADCGGACAPCQDGLGCATGADCASGVCTAGACQSPACNDGIQNGAEPAVDCGGPCPPCADGKACGAGSDCSSGVCAAGVCQIANCADGVENGSETDVDCGGACPPCNTAARCQTNEDCGSGVCAGGLCQPPTCTDGVKNGNETGVDCGGACAVAETCNGIDDDCNGLVDDGLGTLTCGVGACQVTIPSCLAGVVQVCTPLPAGEEVCDGLLDDDCDGVVDNGCDCTNGTTQSCYTGSPATLGHGLCAPGTQTCAHGRWGACVGEVTPTAEACDGLDNDCNGLVDDGLGQTICGIGECQVTAPNCLNGVPQTCVPRPPSPEICDGRDNDCDGQVDDNLPAITCGVGECVSHAPSCVNGAPSTACTPLAPTAEACDGLDNDCDGVIDNGNPGGGHACSTGKLGACAAGQTACSGGAIVCNQTSQPAPEVCNGIDDNCNGSVDEGVLGTFYRDADGDGYGNAGVTAQGCSAPSGYVTNALDCNDGSASIRPGAAEICNGIDDNCNGSVDEGNPGGGAGCGTCGGGTTTCSGGALVCANANAGLGVYFRDADGDGWGNGSLAVQSCGSPNGYVANAGDCNDGNASIHPGAAELCDGIDNNCSGGVDEGSACACATMDDCPTGKNCVNNTCVAAKASCAAQSAAYLSPDGEYWISPSGTPIRAYCDMTLKAAICTETQSTVTGRTRDPSGLAYSMVSVLNHAAGTCSIWNVKAVSDGNPLDRLQAVAGNTLSACRALGFIADSSIGSCAFGNGLSTCGFTSPSFLRWGNLCSGCAQNNNSFNRYVLQGPMTTAHVMSTVSGSTKTVCTVR